MWENQRSQEHTEGISQSHWEQIWPKVVSSGYKSCWDNRTSEGVYWMLMRTLWKLDEPLMLEVEPVNTEKVSFSMYILSWKSLKEKHVICSKGVIYWYSNIKDLIYFQYVDYSQSARVLCTLCLPVNSIWKRSYSHYFKRVIIVNCTWN